MTARVTAVQIALLASISSSLALRNSLSSLASSRSSTGFHSAPPSSSLLVAPSSSSSLSPPSPSSPKTIALPASNKSSMSSFSPAVSLAVDAFSSVPVSLFSGMSVSDMVIGRSVTKPVSRGRW
ncbi:hypothetical protein [Natrinema sp. 1APR25-10V2]|uniref:hypothetical protein n=1 Tax=Natrinema sp. 1APR25-10V2 TaxID=2951081 RepID=UPI0028764EDF|nr:hypothetical protein [Natrinema sp. 1APR25-10V2]MDS0473773.1 hypothetical protein [Natrinema sp. 1APR25-10V2]